MTTKTELAAANATLRARVSELEALAEMRAGRIAKAIAQYRADQAQIKDLSIKLCGQIKRGNLLKARLSAVEPAVEASTPF